MFVPGRETSRLDKVGAASQIALGLALYQFPHEFNAAAYAPFQPYFPFLAVAFMAAGAVLLRGRPGTLPLSRQTLAVLAALPLAAMAAVMGVAGIWTDMLYFGLIGAGLAAAPLHRRSPPDGRDSLTLPATLLFVATGLLLLLAPGLFSASVYTGAGRHALWLGLLGLLAAAAVWQQPARPWRPGARWLWRLAAALYPALIAAQFAASRFWTGVACWAVLALTLLAAGAAQGDGAGMSPLPARVGAEKIVFRRLEQTVEQWTWYLSLLIALTVAMAGQAAFAAPRLAYAFIWAVYFYNVLVHHLLPGLGTPMRRVSGHLAFLAVLSGLLYLAGGPASASYLALLVVIPPLTVQAFGLAAGRRALGLVMAVVVATTALSLLVDGVEPMAAVSAAMLKLIVLLLTASVGMNESVFHVEKLGPALSAVMESEEERGRLVAVLNATPAYVSMTDTAGRFLYVNPAGRRLLGLPETGSLDGHTIFEHYPPQLRQHIRKEARPAAMRTGMWQGESALLTAGGEEIPVLQTVVAHPARGRQPAYFSTIAHNMTVQKQLERRLTHEATHDPLTGLPNRRLFQSELERQLAEATRRGTRLTLMLLDFNGFKVINDRFGHQAGDRVLVQLARLLTRQAGESGLVARIGGDEFAVIVPGAAETEAEQAARRILSAIRREALLVGERPVGVTASIGLACGPDYGSESDDLFLHADMALHQAKAHGKNTHRLYRPDAAWGEQLDARLFWGTRIRQALEQQHFFLECQPIVHLDSGRPAHYELLLRMRGDDGQAVAPGRFLGVAEESDLIHQIDRWVVTQALDMIRGQRGGRQAPTVAVNVSGRTLADPDYLSFLTEELEQGQADGHRLIFEITETAAVTDADLARAFMQTLSQYGCRFSIDDFGAGYTSFGLLRQLPVQFLKVDGAFVRYIAHNAIDQQIFGGMASIAKALGLQVIAEHVADGPTLDFLRAAGVEFGQGFYLGRPEPVTGPWLPPRRPR